MQQILIIIYKLIKKYLLVINLLLKQFYNVNSNSIFKKKINDLILKYYIITHKKVIEGNYKMITFGKIVTFPYGIRSIRSKMISYQS